MLGGSCRDGRSPMLRRLCFGSHLSAVSFEKRRYRCPCCGHTEMESVPFKADSHNITRELLLFTRDLLAYGFTNKEVSELTGLDENFRFFRMMVKPLKTLSKPDFSVL